MSRVSGMVPLILCLLLGGVAAQEKNELRFEVVSLKPNTTAAAASSLRPEPNGLTGVNINALRLLRVAYQVPDFQMVGVPGWFESERYDLQARAAGTVSILQLQEMTRTLLADRFGLRVLRERRRVDGYELRIERPGFAGLQPSSTPCAVAQADQPRATGGLAPCFRAIAGEVAARGVTMMMAAQQLQGYVGQPVVDTTALPGTYDFDLRWAPDLGAGGTAPADADAPSLFTAVREQVGLRLVAAKVAVDVYVITAAHRPDEN